MNKLLLFALLLAASFSFAQSFPPAPGEPGTTAIPKDSSCFIGWADNGTIHRGYVDINDTTAAYDGSNRATFGELSYAFGPAEGNLMDVVSLGDSGYATLTFPLLIIDGPGFDFAIFENGFDDHYMELAHVEISSDGVHFFRFPSTSEIPTDAQLGNGSYSDCGYVNNLAGKYRAGFGTPFDIADIPDDALLNKQLITHVRLIDAIGTITGASTTDQHGTVINDPYPTPFASCGFDLDAVGVINGFVGLDEQALHAQIYPNPTNGLLHVQLQVPGTIALFGTDGKRVLETGPVQQTTLDLKAAGVQPGIYILVASGHADVRVVVL